MSIEPRMSSSHFILCYSLPFLSSIFPSIRVFSSKSSVGIRLPKYWSFSFKSVLPMNIQGWFLQDWPVWSPCCARDSQESSPTTQFKASILQHSAFFIIQLSHPYMTTIKIIAWTIWSFVGKVMSMLFNTLSRFVIAFLPRSKCLLISWLQSPSAVILEPPKKSLSLFPLFLHLFAMKWWDWMSWSSFSECWVLSQLTYSPLSPSSRGSSVPLHFLP